MLARISCNYATESLTLPSAQACCMDVASMLYRDRVAIAQFHIHMIVQIECTGSSVPVDWPPD